MTQYTENYRLELYEGTDKADLTDQYNVSMAILDGAMKGVADDTDASVAGIRADLATTNSNLNATNINLAALDDKVDANQTAQAATNLNFQNEIDTLKSTVDAVPETYATQEALAAVKTEVDKNTPLMEEHVVFFSNLGVIDEESATALHTEIDSAFQGTMSNTTAIEEIRQVITPLNKVDIVTCTLQDGDVQHTILFDVYTAGSFLYYVLSSPYSPKKTTNLLVRGVIPLPDGYSLTACGLEQLVAFSQLQNPSDATIRIAKQAEGTLLFQMRATGPATISAWDIPAFFVPVTKIGSPNPPTDPDNPNPPIDPDNPNPPIGPDNPNPPIGPIATATFGAVPSLETEGGNDGSTAAKFSGSIAGKKLTVNNLSATYEFTSRLGEDTVYMPTSKIVVATVENGTGVEVPTSVKVSSSTLEGSQTYPLAYVNGELSFTPTAQTRNLGAHTGGTSTKELSLAIEFIADPEEPTLNGVYPICLSGSRDPGRSNAVESFEIKGTISYNEGVVSEVALNQGSGVLCVLTSANPAYLTELVDVSRLEITGEHLPDTLTFEAQLFQDRVRATKAVEFAKTGDKLVADDFRLTGDLHAAQNGFENARLSFILS